MGPKTYEEKAEELRDEIEDRLYPGNYRNLRIQHDGTTIAIDIRDARAFETVEEIAYDNNCWFECKGMHVYPVPVRVHVEY